MKNIQAGFLAAAVSIFAGLTSPVTLAAQEQAPAAAPAASAAETGDVAAPALDPVACAAAAAAYASSILEPLASYSGASAECAAALSRAFDLAAQGKWRSAYDGLVSFDAKSSDPYALAMEIDLVLGGALRSDQHSSFALKDLALGETVGTLRQTEGEYDLFPFNPPAFAAAQSASGVAAPAVLSKVLGNYYYDVVSLFSVEGAPPDTALMAACLDNYAKAFAAGLYDAGSLNRQVEFLFKAERSAEAEPVLRKAIELSPQDPAIRINLALCLFDIKHNEEGMKALGEAIAAYGEAPERLQAVAFGARKAAELGYTADYERYLGVIAQAMPDNPTPGLLRHMISVERGWADAATKAADDLMASYPSSPTVIRTLVSTWYNQGKAAEAEAFLKRHVAAAGDEAQAAAFNFYLAVLLGQDAATDADRAAALAALDAAEAGFKKGGKPEDDEVFGVIAELRASIAGVAKAAEESATPAAVDGSAPADSAEAAGTAP